MTPRLDLDQAHESRGAVRSGTGESADYCQPSLDSFYVPILSWPTVAHRASVSSVWTANPPASAGLRSSGDATQPQRL